MNNLEDGTRKSRKKNLATINKLEGSNLLIESFLDSMNVICFKVDINGRIVFFNREAETETGYSRKEVLGRLLEEVLIPEDFREEARNLILSWKESFLMQSTESSISETRLSSIPLLTKHGAIKYAAWKCMESEAEGSVNHIVVYGINITEEKKEKDKLKELLYVDELTGIPNRKWFDVNFKRMWSNSAISKSKIALLICDIDNFKIYNDMYGYQRGDECLIKVAAIIKRICEDIGYQYARWGEDRFLVYKNDNKVIDIVIVAEVIKREIERLKLRIKKAGDDIITLSIGITYGKPVVNSNINQFIDRADLALYRVKKNGKNMIEIM